MRVGMIVRSSLFKTRGGDTIQISETARCLDHLGVHVRIMLANEKIPYGDFDLFHFFNITRPADILRHLNKIHQPVILTSIYINNQNSNAVFRKGLSFFSRMLTEDQMEYIKAIARGLNRTDEFPDINYLRFGQHTSIKNILNRVDKVITVSDREQELIFSRYHVPFNYTNILPGLSETFLKSFSFNKKEDDLVLCVSRIEANKNQLNLIKALNDTKYRLIIVGDAAPNQTDYYMECRKSASSNISFLPFMSHDGLRELYLSAKVHVLPSFFENFGLSTLEAISMGCQVVVGENGFISDVIGDFAFYCDPASPSSIYSAVDKAAKAPDDLSVIEKVRQMTWLNAAEKIKLLYHSILD